MRLRHLALGLVVPLALTGCGPHVDSSIGVRAQALDLQFARPDLAVPVPPSIVVKLLPAPPPSLQHVVVPSPPPVIVFPTPPPPTCPAASAPGRRGTPLAETTQTSPKPGFYVYDSKGKATVSGSTPTLTADVPKTTNVTITAGTPVAPDQTIDVEGGAPKSGKLVEYSVTTALSSTFRQVDTLQVSATSINLVKRQLVSPARSFTTTFTPHVQIMKFGKPGTTWSSRGVDSDNAASFDYSASIDGVTEVKVCGVVTPAYTVTYQSTLTNVSGSEVIRTGTDSAHPASFTIAPQLGGLILSQQVYSEDVALYPSLGAYVGTTLDYASTLTDLEPTT